jgi:hypothetical protein
MAATLEKDPIPTRVAALNSLAQRDQPAAQQQLWAWLKELGSQLPGPAAEAELAALYAAGTPADADGPTEGLLVGFVTPTGLDRTGRLLLPLAKTVVNRAPRMPWLGKRFDQQAHQGTNAVTGLVVALARVLAPRYRFAKVGDHYEGFRMRNWVEKSVISPGTTVLVLDYEAAEMGNPWPISKIRDEAVQIVPGTYLGAKLWHQADGYQQIAWWAAKAPTA